MSIALVAFGCILLLAIPFAVVLSVCIGVGGCGCPISSSRLRCGTACFAFMNKPAISASAADDSTAFMTEETLSTAPLLSGLSVLEDKKWWPPTRLRECFSFR